MTRLNFAGQIQLIIGPMFSGKTTELIRRIQRYSIAQARCLLIKHSKDDRYDEDSVITHDKRTIVSNKYIDRTSTNDLKHLLENIRVTDYDCIGIDEGQFVIGPLALRAKFEEMVASLGNADIDIRS
eukprot:sb/3475457/